MIPTLRDVSLFILSTLAFVMCLMPLAVLFFAVRGTALLERKAQPLRPQVQAQVRRARDLVDSGSDRVAAPVIRVHGAWTRWTTTLRVLTGSPKNRDH